MISQVDRKVFEAQTAPLRETLAHAAIRLCGGDQALAEDMLQNTYLKAWLHYHRFKPGTNLRAWLHRILFNNVVSEYRQKSHARESIAVRAAAPSEGAFAEGGLDWEQVTDEVKQALDSLPGEYRHVFLLAAVEEKSIREIAEALALPEGTVMSRLWRARRRLQESLAEEPAASLN